MMTDAELPGLINKHVRPPQPEATEEQLAGQAPGPAPRAG